MQLWFVKLQWNINFSGFKLRYGNSWAFFPPYRIISLIIQFLKPIYGNNGKWGVFFIHIRLRINVISCIMSPYIWYIRVIPKTHWTNVKGRVWCINFFQCYQDQIWELRPFHVGRTTLTRGPIYSLSKRTEWKKLIYLSVKCFVRR